MTSRAPNESVKTLVVEDDDGTADVIQAILLTAGRDSHRVSNAEQARKALEAGEFEVAVIDLQLESGSAIEGYSVLKRVRGMDMGPEAIVCTSSTIKDWLMETLDGARYVRKRNEAEFKDELIAAVTDAAKAFRKRSLAERRRSQRVRAFESLIRAPGGLMEDFIDLMGRFAGSDHPVLLLGENGTGKTMLGEAMHYASPRAQSGKCVRFRATDKSPTLIMDELLGHVTGAFTGADRDRIGYLRQADHGTLVIDEIGEAPPDMQRALLVLEKEKRFKPNGSDEDVEVDCRLICTTNRDLKNDVETGRFREDLYYRLAVLSETVPPLRDRPDDIPWLIEHFAAEAPDDRRSVSDVVTDEALDLLLRYDWPGNVRQLEGTHSRGLVLAEGGLIDVEHLPPEIRESSRPLDVGDAWTKLERFASGEDLAFENLASLLETVLPRNKIDRPELSDTGIKDLGRHGVTLRRVIEGLPGRKWLGRIAGELKVSDETLRGWRDRLPR